MVFRGSKRFMSLLNTSFTCRESFAPSSYFMPYFWTIVLALPTGLCLKLFPSGFQFLEDLNTFLWPSCSRNFWAYVFVAAVGDMKLYNKLICWALRGAMFTILVPPAWILKTVHFIHRLQAYYGFHVILTVKKEISNRLHNGDRVLFGGWNWNFYYLLFEVVSMVNCGRVMR